MAAQEAEFDDEEIVTDEKHVAESDLKKLRDSHFKVSNLHYLKMFTKIVSDIPGRQKLVS